MSHQILLNTEFSSWFCVVQVKKNESAIQQLSIVGRSIWYRNDCPQPQRSFLVSMLTCQVFSSNLRKPLESRNLTMLMKSPMFAISFLRVNSSESRSLKQRTFSNRSCKVMPDPML
ncbi:hypothetical protein FGO68_gene15557 [Halteria grandinella]|uniref:Uncharacterized protein n=1 Tax=Halteria grandinella TaxID=5974 RepID=A0A8J8NC31_HALGN|nr:hypothetical protein FGO68_gene15557 [Halteria grandinella]